MKKLMIFLIACIPFVLIMVVQLTSTVIQETQYVAVEKLFFEKDEMVVEKLDYQNVPLQFPAKINPVGATDKDVIYSSSNTDIAVVDSFGNITFKDFGYVTIYAQSVDNKALITECRFHVTDNKAHRVEIVDAPKNMMVNTTYFIRANIIPAEALDKSLTYTSSNPDVADVMPDGMIKAINGGTTTITLRSANGCEASFDLNVIVPVSGIILSESVIVTAETNINFPLFEVTPNTATNKNVEYLSSNEDIATINSNGEITFNRAGTVKFRVTTVDGGFYKECEVTCTNGYILYGSLLTSSINVDYALNKELNIETTIFPLNANRQNVYFVSKNENVVKVDDQGKPIVVGGGSASVDVFIKTSATESEKLGTVSVFINRLIENVVVENQIETSVREYQIDYNIVPQDHTGSVVFEIESSVATVNNNGLVEFSAPGVAVVTLKTNNGINKTITLTYSPAGAKVVEVNAETINASVNYLDSTFVLMFNNSLNMISSEFVISDVNVVEYNLDSQVFNILKGGTTKITATSTNGNVCEVNLQVVRNVSGINATIVGFGDSVTIITASKSVMVNAEVLPADATNKNIEYYLNDGATATVDNNGVLTFADKSETVELFVKAAGSANAIKQFTITYTNGKPNEFELETNQIELEEIGTTFNVGALLFKSFNPTDYVFNISDFEILSLNESVVKVLSGGIIETVSGGEATFKITAKDSGFVKTVNVKVVINATGVDFTYNNNLFDGGKIIGSTIQLGAKVYPDNATNKNVEYQIVSGNVATVSSDGLVTFTSNGQVIIKVKTRNNKENVITLEKVSGPTSIIVYKENVNVSNNVINIPLNNVGNVVLRVEVSGIVDVNNINYSNILVVANNDNGLSINVKDNGSGYFTIEKTITIAKSVKSELTFNYGTSNVKTTIKYCQLNSLSMVLDSNSLYGTDAVKVTLNNADDVKYGLERKRVFGVSSYYNSAKTNKLKLDTIKNVEAQLDDVYWFSENTQIAYFANSTSGELTIVESAVTKETKLKIYACSEPSLTAEGAIITCYEFTFVPKAMNIFSVAGYQFAYDNYINIVMQVNMGSKNDEAELKASNPTAPFVGFDPATHDESNFTKSYIRSEIYGNGYTINYNGYSSEWRGQIIFWKNARNLTLKCQNFDQTKDSYVNEAASAGATLSYMVIQNGKRGIYTGKNGSLIDTTLQNCIIKHMLEYAILISDHADITLYLENVLFYDCGQAAINFQMGNIKIKGLFNVINFRSPAEFNTFGFTDVLKNAYSSSAFNEYVDKSAGNAKDYKVNLAIAATPKNLLGSPDSSASNVYFWDSSKNDYVANSDKCTGLGYNKLSYTNGKILKTTIYLWTTKLSALPVNATIDESVIYRQV